MSLAPASPALLLSDVLLELHTQTTFAGVMDALVRAAGRLGLRCCLGSLLRDAGTEGWHLTALWDVSPVPRPVDLRGLGVPLGPFEFVVPATRAPRPLADLFGTAWGTEACAHLAHRLGVAAAVSAPIVGPAGPRGALLALLAEPAPAAMVVRLLGHAAVAAAVCLQREAPSGDGVLDPATLAAAAEEEIMRARRYGRPLAVVAVRLERVADLAPVGRLVGQHLSRWDRLGRLATTAPALALVLPETDRGGALNLIARLRGALPGTPMAAAVFPHDGTTYAQLVELALGRSALVQAEPGQAVPPAPLPQAGEGWPQAGVRIGAGPPDGRPDLERWTRGAPAGPGQDTVRCPRCLVSYTRCRPFTAPGGVPERVRAIARAALHQSCPDHPAHLDLPTGTTGPSRFGTDPLAA
jgi:hypothetical protein